MNTPELHSVSNDIEVYDLDGAARYGRKRALGLAQRAAASLSSQGPHATIPLSPVEVLSLVAAAAEGDPDFQAELDARILDAIERLSYQLVSLERL